MESVARLSSAERRELFGETTAHTYPHIVISESLQRRARVKFASTDSMAS